VFPGGTFTLLSNSGGRLVANFSFPDIAANFNNTAIACRDIDQRSNELIFLLAGMGGREGKREGGKERERVGEEWRQIRNNRLCLPSGINGCGLYWSDS